VGVLTRLARVIETLAIVLAIAYVAFLLMSRTEGFRGLVADQLQEVVGLPISIAGSRARPDFDIVLEGLATEGDGRKNRPSVRAQRVVIEWSPLDVLRNRRLAPRALLIDDAEVTFATTVSGQWAPAAMAPLSEKIASWLGVDLKTPGKALDRAGPPAGADSDRGAGREPVWSRCRLQVRRAAMSWWADEQNEVAGIAGLSADVTPMRVPGRRLTHFLLMLDHAASTNGFGIQDVRIELIDAGDQQVVLSFQGDGRKTAPR
jgi:hypothetical protein